MDEKTLAAIEARAAAATEGPWRLANGKGSAMVVSNGPDKDTHCAIYLNVRTVELDDTVARWQADAAFIAHARSDIPSLCQALREAVQRERGLRETVARMCEQAIAALDQDNVPRRETERLIGIIVHTGNAALKSETP